MHRIREAGGRERPTVRIKGGLVDGLDWSKAKHIYTETAVVEVPESVESWKRSPDVMEGREERK